jgi:hypothetical protein
VWYPAIKGRGQGANRAEPELNQHCKKLVNGNVLADSVYGKNAGEVTGPGIFSG